LAKVQLKSAQNIMDRRTGSRDDHGTPTWFYRYLDGIFKFQIDVCAKASNHKHENYYSLEKGQDALQLPWLDRAFSNPPYGRRLPKFLKKGYEESKNGSLVVFLITAKPDTQWWHRYVWASTEVWELEGRLTFEGSKDPAPFPSCVVIFRPGQLNLPGGPRRVQVNLKELKKRLTKEEVVILGPIGGTDEKEKQ
jgi:site-specific DNA-methyltransferase (adenine-specific)